MSVERQTKRQADSVALEFFVFVNDLNAMAILRLGGRIANCSEVAVHFGGSCNSNLQVVDIA